MRQEHSRGKAIGAGKPQEGDQTEGDLWAKLGRMYHPLKGFRFPANCLPKSPNRAAVIPSKSIANKYGSLQFYVLLAPYQWKSLCLVRDLPKAPCENDPHKDHSFNVSKGESVSQ